jgi:heptosyltransferase I
MIRTLPFQAAPGSLCILRLSAVGDISHTLPAVRSLQNAWPKTKLYWIIGKLEYELVKDIPGIKFLIFDKKLGLTGYRQLYQQLKGHQFDALLHMQMSLRASLIAMMVNTPIKLGFDRKRAKDLQWLFTNHKIAYQPKQHVIDSFFGFVEALGISDRLYKWDIPIPDADREFAAQHLATDKPALIISPCSSMAYRNWTIDGYYKVAEYAVQQHQMQVVLTGGPSDIEKTYGEQICKNVNVPVTNLIGQTTLKQLLAILAMADVVISPDAGPAHLATAVGTPVIGLYATTNPDRARPYLSAEYVVNRYEEAVNCKYGKPVDALPWGIRVKDAGTMERITVDEVIAMLDKSLLKSTS